MEGKLYEDLVRISINEKDIALYNFLKENEVKLLEHEKFIAKAIKK